VPPIRSVFPDSGPDPDFFELTSPVLVRFLLLQILTLSSSFSRRSNQSRLSAADIKYLSIPKRSQRNKYLFDGKHENVYSLPSYNSAY
jgi:hypothetical protein